MKAVEGVVNSHSHAGLLLVVPSLVSLAPLLLLLIIGARGLNDVLVGVNRLRLLFILFHIFCDLVIPEHVHRRKGVVIVGLVEDVK